MKFFLYRVSPSRYYIGCEPGFLFGMESNDIHTALLKATRQTGRKERSASKTEASSSRVKVKFLPVPILNEEWRGGLVYKKYTAFRFGLGVFFPYPLFAGADEEEGSSSIIAPFS